MMYKNPASHFNSLFKKITGRFTQTLHVEGPYLSGAIIVYLILICPFLGVLPYLDGNIDFVKSVDYFEGGISQLLANWRSIHPPLKELVIYVFFKLLGVNSIAYTLPGILFGILGIIFFYLLIKTNFKKGAANLAVFLLATSPMYLSTGLFALTDFILTVFLVMSLYAYTNNKWILLAFSLVCAVLTKETALVLPFTLILIEIYDLLSRLYHHKPFVRSDISKLIILILPLVIIFGWNKYLSSSGRSVWGDWNFSSTAEKGTIYTILYNITHLKIFNQFAFQNWQQVFILNFSWIYWLLIIILFVVLKRKLSAAVIRKPKLIPAVGGFFLLYLLTVLSFQTYTIPRYALPLDPIRIGTFSLFVSSLGFNKTVKFLALPVLAVIIIIQLFFSLDPLSAVFWHDTKILGEKVYALNQSLAGNDGITYNMQYLFIAKRRTGIIEDAFYNYSERYTDCYWLFPDPNNDRKTAAILNINKSSTIKKCLSGE